MSRDAAPLEPAHGGSRRFPAYLAREVETIHGDLRNRDDVMRALQGVEAGFHFAAAVGLGHSMYEIESYTDIDNRGPAVLREALLRRPAARRVVASSMSGRGLVA